MVHILYFGTLVGTWLVRFNDTRSVRGRCALLVQGRYEVRTQWGRLVRSWYDVCTQSGRLVRGWYEVSTMSVRGPNAVGTRSLFGQHVQLLRSWYAGGTRY